MQQVTVGSKNQIVIPKQIREKIKGLKPGKKVSVYPLDEETIAVKVSAEDWLKRSYGAMKDAWKDFDPIKEIEEMRNEWDEK